MPPKGKSSSGSSHSSRSRSSSSISRSSRSSSSSSYKSSPSRSSSYSSSSHSSRSRVPLTSNQRYAKTNIFSGTSTREYRYPTSGYRRTGNNMMGRLILHDALHDYTYVPNDYIDSDGNQRQSGYYDENGTYYKKGNFENQTMELTCPYCDSKNKIVWTEGVLPRCPVCGGEYDLTGQSTVRTSTYAPTLVEKKKTKSRIIIVVAVLVFLYLYGAYLLKKETNPNNTTYKTTEEIRQSSAQDIFVEEIGRTCVWDAENEWWVDKKSGCYFYFDETIAPSQWKYWYDGIGDDYGDFGWMEFDDEEGIWYIETEENNWKVLPSKYDLKGVWHMKDAFQEPVVNN